MCVVKLHIFVHRIQLDMGHHYKAGGDRQQWHSVEALSASLDGRVRESEKFWLLYLKLVRLGLNRVATFVEEGG